MNTKANAQRLSQDALAIWRAGVEAVKPAKLLAAKASVQGATLRIDDIEIDFSAAQRLVVVGAGKASGTLAIEFQKQITSQLRQAVPELAVAGWVNCPANSYSQAEAPEDIRLFEARPAGINEPTAKAVLGTQKIIELVRDCDERDIVVCLLSGGGSALLTAPSPGITLEDKQTVARMLAAAGANIEQLNTVRRALSEVKGGGLARACNAGRLLTVIISDVLGDDLQTIASGPTVLGAKVDSQAALQVLESLNLIHQPQLANVIDVLRNKQATTAATETACHVEHVLLGNNADAVDAAAVKAVDLGYRYVMECARQSEGDVLNVAEHAVQATQQLLAEPQIDCWISGGEPTVTLPKSLTPGKGGRNQQLALAVLEKLTLAGWPNAHPQSAPEADNLAFVSGGTDGEDGPTDAAGAWFDHQLYEQALQKGLDMRRHLAEANAYPFFDQFDGLIRTGPTGTNVCDLRVALTNS